MGGESTFLMIKPAGWNRRYEIVNRLSENGLTLTGMVELPRSEPHTPEYRLLEETLREHYAEHADKDFFEPLVSYMAQGPLVPSVWSGEGAIASARRLVGATDPYEAVPGTIRHDFAPSGLEELATGDRIMRGNVIHASDSPQAAEREIELWSIYGNTGWSQDGPLTSYTQAFSH